VNPLAVVGGWIENGVPIGKAVENLVEFMEERFAGAFDGFSEITLFLIEGIEGLLASTPFWALLLVFTGIAWRVAGWRLGLFTAIGLALTFNIGMWDSFLATLTLVVVAELLVVLLGLPFGVLAATSEIADRIIRPILDFMQTMPAFVYLIPAVSFFGLGVVPGVVATVIFAIPPLIRLTNLGIRQVAEDLIEASDAFGATRWQKLYKVQLPVATPTIMAGVNQSIMLNLSMVVIAALIGAQGLGGDVIRGMNILDIGLGFEAGLAIVIMAIILDRITQRLGASPGQQE
jgi:glycine betaine/proline transport system permease protein